MPSETPPTLFDWAGGRDAFERLINAFYDRVEGDDLLSPLFPGGVSAEHRDHVTAWWTEVFGGPTRYTDELGGYEQMLSKHRDLAITAEQRFRFASLMSRAADDAELPDDPEFRSALVAYLEWGTRIALSNSQPDAEVVEHAPVPRWGWGEAPPFHPYRSDAQPRGRHGPSVPSMPCFTEAPGGTVARSSRPGVSNAALGVCLSCSTRRVG